jgi:hypothetical protein
MQIPHQITLLGIESVGICAPFDSSSRFQWNSGPSCVQGRGYYTGSSLPRWYNAGCGPNGSVSAYIGNVYTVAKIRGYAAAVGKIGYVRWR